MTVESAKRACVDGIVRCARAAAAPPAQVELGGIADAIRDR